MALPFRFPFQTTSLVLGLNTYHFRMMSAADADSFAKATEGVEGYGSAGLLVVRTLCDEAGVRLLSDDQLGELMAAVPYTDLLAMHEAAARINGFTKSAVDDAEKN